MPAGNKSAALQSSPNQDRDHVGEEQIEERPLELTKRQPQVRHSRVLAGEGAKFLETGAKLKMAANKYKSPKVMLISFVSASSSL